MSRKIDEMTALAEYRDGLRRKPRLVYLFLELTDRCNMNCLHCGSSCKPSNSQFLSLENVLPVLKSIKESYLASSVMICLTGGEPLLHPDFEAFVRAIYEMGFPWGITTNGLLIDDAMIRLFRQCELPSVTLSLDGLEETNDWFRRRKGAYREILECIRRLHNSGLAVQVTTVVHKRNLEELDVIYHVLAEQGIQSWRLTNIEPIGRALEREDLLLSPQDYRTLFEYIRNKRFGAGTGMEVTYRCPHFLTLEYERELRDYYFICGSGIYVASILCNGDIFSCLDIERSPELIQGNIARDDFLNVWENRFEVFRRDRTEDCAECRSCNDRYLCGGDSTHTWNFTENKPSICMRKLLRNKRSTGKIDIRVKV